MKPEVRQASEQALRELPEQETRINWELADKIKEAKAKIKENGRTNG